MSQPETPGGPGGWLKRLGRRLRGGAGARPEPEPVHALYQERDFLAAYAAHTDLRVAEDPAAAVGGLWEELGSLQFDFLRSQGLRPEHRLLDFGCGTLRGGRHFIAYLDAGLYTGLDISPAALAYGRELVEREGLSAKAPKLVLGLGQDLRFVELAGARFDVVLAQSVFTHLPPELIAEAFAHLRTVMAPDARFYFTYHHAPQVTRTGLKDFRYPLSHFEGLATDHGFALSDLSAAYPHPRGQRMVRLTEGAGTGS